MSLPRLELRGIFFVVFCLTIFFAVVIRDPDFFFHVKAGQDILRSGAIPTVDSYSFTHEGGVWHAQEWLFEVVIYLLFAQFGYLGIKLFIALMGSAALIFAASALPQRRNLDLPAVALTAPLLLPFLTPRP